MNSETAKKILALYRPGTADRNDPEIEEALNRARPFPARERGQEDSPELSGWFREHCSSYLSIRGKFRAIPVPPTLKERILAEHKARATPPPEVIHFRPMTILQMAAALVVCMGLAVLLWRSHGRQVDFSTYRSRMTRTALQPYGMDLASHELAVINAYLAAHQAPANYVLPKGVSKAEAVGCAVLKWQGHPVSMICFHSGQPANAGETTDLWLFVIDRASLLDAPGQAPVIAPMKKLTTATWTLDGKTYLLATDGNEEFLRKYF